MRICVPVPCFFKDDFCDALRTIGRLGFDAAETYNWKNLDLDKVRATCEETGVEHLRPVSEDIFSLESLTVDGHEKRGEYVPSHLHLNVTYLIEADEHDTLHICEGENSGVRWFTLDEALKASSEPWFVERIYKKLNSKLRELTPDE